MQRLDESKKPVILAAERAKVKARAQTRRRALRPLDAKAGRLQRQEKINQPIGLKPEETMTAKPRSTGGATGLHPSFRQPMEQRKVPQTVRIARIEFKTQAKALQRRWGR